MRIVYFSVILSLLLISPLYADGIHPAGIKLDGTIGNAGKIDLPGPDYAIRAELGRQAGSNLFHSFEQFNLHNGESATFSGPDSVKNIISRVTGGSASWIDGKLASTIPNADLYFLNPFGIMFGSNASLDLKGSFHVSTADYLKMGDNERFYATPIANEILSVAAPSAFGFLSDTPAKISIEGKGEISADEWIGNPSGLAVPENRTISIVGGNIEISKGTFYSIRETDADGNPVFEQAFDENGNPIQSIKKVSPGDIRSLGGRINIVSVASPGEVTDKETGPDITCSGKGNIRLSDKAVLDSSGGSIFIRGGQVTLEDSVLRAEISGDKAGGKIDIQADTVSLSYGAEISGNTSGSGKGADIFIQADDSLRAFGANSEQESVTIATETSGMNENAGDAGSIMIVSGNISFADGAVISSNTDGNGKGGKISLKADDSVSFAGKRSEGIITGIDLGSVYSGDAGSLSIEAENLRFSEDAFINSTTWRQGKGGEITLKARDSVFFSGSIIQLLTVSQEKDAGIAGSLKIDAGSIFFDNGAIISSNTYGSGRGGQISLKARDSVSFAGKISEGIITGIDLASVYSGDAGSLSIEAENLRFSEDAFINSTTWRQGKGGEITLKARDSVFFNDSIVQTATVSDEDGAGDAGSLSIEAGSIFLKGAILDSNTYCRGTGGHINLRAETIKCSADSSGKFTLIYAGTRSDSEMSGSGGEIHISGQNLLFEDRTEISTSTLNDGKAGNIALDGSHIEIVNKTAVSSESKSPENGGEAGSISVTADSISISGSSSLSTEAKGAGGGKINVNAGNMLYLNDSDITSSVKQGEGKGGDVTIGNPDTGTGSRFVILNRSHIQANAQDGDGGAVFIVTENFLKSFSSIVEATSARGNEGTVKIEAPDFDISGSLTVLPGTYFDAGKWVYDSCESRSGKVRGRFTIRRYVVPPDTLGDSGF